MVFICLLGLGLKKCRGSSNVRTVPTIVMRHELGELFCVEIHGLQ